MRLRPSQALRTSALKSALLAYVAIVGFPANERSIQPGLDGSWQYALNYLANSPFVFGHDVNFTYGPLGFLIVPEPVGPNLRTGVAVALVIYATFVALIAVHLARADVEATVLFVAGLVAARASGLYFESSLLLLIGLLVLLPAHGRRARAGVLILGAAFAGACLLVKISLSLELFSIVAVASVLAPFALWRGSAARLVVACATYAVVATIVGLWLLRTPLNFVQWLVLSSDVVRGYDMAMALPGPLDTLVLGLLLLSGFVGLAVVSLLRPCQLAPALLVFTPAAILNFKHGFVRQDDHILVYFPLILGMCAVVVLVSRCGAVRRLSAGLLLAAIVANLATTARIASPSAASVVLGAAGLGELAALTHPDLVARRLTADSDTALARQRLPDTWVSQIRAAGASVDAVPWDVSYAVANDLPWRPNPVLQTYLAYTTQLDDLAAQHFAGPTAPEFVIATLEGFDGRNPLTDSPAVWRALLANYSVQARVPSNGPLLLRKRPAPVEWADAAVARQRVMLNQVTRVPASRGLLLAHIDLSLGLRGLLSRALLRVAPIDLHLQYRSGRTADVRVISETLHDGIILNRLPSTADDLATLFDSAQSEPVDAFSLTGPGVPAYSDTAPIEWEDVTWPAPSHG